MKLFLLFTLFFASQGYSQSNTLEKLVQNRQELQKKILFLQDSLNTLEKEIAHFPIEVISEPIQAFVIKGTILREKPNFEGRKLEVFKEKSVVQVIDIYKDYFLVCLSGNCGYVNKKNVRRKLSSI